MPNLETLTESHRHLDAALRLYRRSFPSAERENVTTLRTELAGKSRLKVQFAALVSGDAADDRLLGFIRLAELPGISAEWLIHIAVETAARGRGAGKQMMQAVLARSAGRLFIELDRPEDAESGADREIRNRRLRWYLEMGGRILSTDYTQPSLGRRKPPVRLYLLMIGPVSNAEADVRGFYREAWERRDGDEFVERACRAIMTS
jgi:ribosomal protein S18 acetylase RimI-like enzyme